MVLYASGLVHIGIALIMYLFSSFNRCDTYCAWALESYIGTWIGKVSTLLDMTSDQRQLLYDLCLDVSYSLCTY